MACPVGYKCENSDGDFKCSFVDHCEENPCAAGLECSNTIDGSFKCNDIDECVNEPCNKGEECINLHGGYRCDDVDECKRGVFKFKCCGYVWIPIGLVNT